MRGHGQNDALGSGDGSQDSIAQYPSVFPCDG